MNFDIGSKFKAGRASDTYYYTSLRNEAILEVIERRKHFSGDRQEILVKIVSGRAMVGTSYWVNPANFHDATMVRTISVASNNSDFRTYSPFDTIRL